MPFIRSDQALINVEIVGVFGDKEPWSSLDGFDNTLVSAQAFPGGMKPLVELGGFPKPTLGTLTRPWEAALIGPYKKMWNAAGQAEVKVTVQYLNAERKPIPGSEPIVYSGILGTPTRPGYKAGTSEEGKLQITVMPHGEIA